MPEKGVVLVTGISGDLGQAVVKCLRLYPESVRVIGCDMEPGVGAAFADTVFTVPRADDSAYLDRIREICDTMGITGVIPASEPEIFALSRAAAEEKLGIAAPLICQPYQWLDSFGDKLSCFMELDKAVPLAAYGDGTDPETVHRFVEEDRFPCIVKSRRSWGSKSLRLATNPEELEVHIRETPMPLVQEFIDDEGGEFSVGVFSCDHFTTVVAFKRQLGPVGASWYADNFDQDKEVLDYCLKVAEAAGLQGSCNVQVRKSSQGVRLLEINPRFSSLLAARAICGFKDLEWSLRLALGHDIEPPDGKYKPIRFQRFFHELIDFGSGYAAPEQWRPRSG